MALIKISAANPMQRHGALPNPIQARGSSVISGSSVERAEPIQQVFCSRGRNGQNRESVAPLDDR